VLRVYDTLRKIRTEKADGKILAITSSKSVAAETHYHASCNKN
jgi:hypothetical protein